jgi:hypothetical protein
MLGIRKDLASFAFCRYAAKLFKHHRLHFFKSLANQRHMLLTLIDFYIILPVFENE